MTFHSDPRRYGAHGKARLKAWALGCGWVSAIVLGLGLLWGLFAAVVFWAFERNG